MGDKKCPHGYTKRAACTTCDHEDDLKEKDAEIERLTAAVATREAAYAALTIDCKRFEVERARLRAALQGLYDAVWESDPAARATVAARDALLGASPDTSGESHG